MTLRGQITAPASALFYVVRIHTARWCMLSLFWWLLHSACTCRSHSKTEITVTSSGQRTPMSRTMGDTKHDSVQNTSTLSSIFSRSLSGFYNLSSSVVNFYKWWILRVELWYGNNVSICCIIVCNLFSFADVLHKVYQTTRGLLSKSKLQSFLFNLQCVPYALTFIPHLPRSCTGWILFNNQWRYAMLCFL